MVVGVVASGSECGSGLTRQHPKRKAEGATWPGQARILGGGGAYPYIYMPTHIHNVYVFIHVSNGCLFVLVYPCLYKHVLFKDVCSHAHVHVHADIDIWI